MLEAMRTVPREAFLPPELAEFAYEDHPLPIAAGQTISQPYIVALMTAALELGPHDRVLEIGTGSGYAAAILGRIAREVYTIERHGELADAAAARLRDQRPYSCERLLATATTASLPVAEPLSPSTAPILRPTTRRP